MKILQEIGLSSQRFTRRRFLLALAALFPSLAVLRDEEPAKKIGGGADYHHHTSPPGEPLPRELESWKGLPRRPIWKGAGGLDSVYIEAIRRREPLYVTYRSRQNQRQIRRLTPMLLFTVDRPDADSEGSRRTLSGSGRIYLQAWDYDRRAERTFDTGRLTLLLTAPWMFDDLAQDSITPPQEVRARTYAWLWRHNVEPVPSSSFEPATYSWKE